MRYRQPGNQKGIARLAALLVILVLVLLAVSLYPSWKRYRTQAKTLACAAGLDTARRQLASEYMIIGENGSAEDARDFVGYVMAGWDDLCPDGGSVYIVPSSGSELAWDVVCGLHASDTKLRTRLNAKNVLEQLEAALLKAREEQGTFPAELTVTLHHKTFTALLVEEETGFRFGTALTFGVDGTVVRYGLAGYGSFAQAAALQEGELCYFSFADEAHCAAWTPQDGWTGDAWTDVD